MTSENLSSAIAERVRRAREVATAHHRSSLFVLVGSDGQVLQQGIGSNPGRAIRHLSTASRDAALNSELWVASITLEKAEFRAEAWTHNPLQVRGSHLRCAAFCDKRLNVQKNRVFGCLQTIALEYADSHAVSLYQAIMTGEVIARNVLIRLKEKIPC